MGTKVKYVTVDLGSDNCSVRVFNEHGYMSTICHPGRISAQSMGTQVVVEDGSNVSVYDCSDGYPKRVSNRTKTR